MGVRRLCLLGVWSLGRRCVRVCIAVCLHLPCAGGSLGDTVQGGGLPLVLSWPSADQPGSEHTCRPRLSVGLCSRFSTLLSSQYALLAVMGAYVLLKRESWSERQFLGPDWKKFCWREKLIYLKCSTFCIKGNGVETSCLVRINDSSVKTAFFCGLWFACVPPVCHSR